MHWQLIPGLRTATANAPRVSCVVYSSLICDWWLFPWLCHGVDKRVSSWLSEWLIWSAKNGIVLSKKHCCQARHNRLINHLTGGLSVGPGLVLRTDYPDNRAAVLLGRRGSNIHTYRYSARLCWRPAVHTWLQMTVIIWQVTTRLRYTHNWLWAEWTASLPAHGRDMQCPDLLAQKDIFDPDILNPILTKPAVFFIRRSTRSCCQTTYC